MKESLCYACPDKTKADCPKTVALIGETSCEFIDIAEMMTDSQLREFILRRLDERTGQASSS